LIHVKGKTTVLFSGVVVNEGLGWRRSTVSGRHGESEQYSRSDDAMCRKGNGMGLLTYGPRAGDKLADPRGAAACRLWGWVRWEW
jgi:hypothetical protein